MTVFSKNILGLSQSLSKLLLSRTVDWLKISILAFLTYVLLLSSSVYAAQVNLLNSASTSASGTGSIGTPSLIFNIPAGKNRTLFIWAGFERDHCSATDNCNADNTAGTGLGDNWPVMPYSATPQLTARVIGSSGAIINKKNALVIGGTPSGDLRFQTISTSPTGSPVGTAYFSLSSYHIALLESEINQVLNGAASGTVNISLPDVFLPLNSGDEAYLIVSVYENVSQTDTGIVRNAIAFAQATGTPSTLVGNYSLTPSSYDVGQVPNENEDGQIIMGLSSTHHGFSTPANYTSFATQAINSGSGIFDLSTTIAPTFNIDEPSGSSAAGFFRNNNAAGALYTLQSTAPSTTPVYGGISQSFLLESDNDDTSDAPSSYGHPTHPISGIRLGASVDADAAILANSTATGDDTNGTDDEDGVTMPASLTTGQTATIPVSIQNASGVLNVWFDWNKDGDFLDSGEQVVSEQAVATGTTNLNITVPTTASGGTTFARFRACSTTSQCNTPTSVASTGEVEDHTANIVAPMDYSDAPATYGTPSHTIVSGIRLGATAPDNEAAAQPSTDANLDDTTGTDDEDGITLPTLTQGQTATITATVTGAGGYLQGWIDWNGDGSFDTNERIAANLQDNDASDLNSSVGSLQFAVSVPSYAVTTATYARFRWSNTVGLDAISVAASGEVEDYRVTISNAPSTINSSCNISALGGTNGSSLTWPGTPSTLSITTNNNWSATPSGVSFYDSQNIKRTLSNSHRWDRFGNSNLTLSFSPAIPAKELVLFINDVGTGGTGAYDPHYTITVSGGAAPSNFVMKPLTDGSKTLAYIATSGTILKSSLDFSRESGVLVGQGTNLISQLSMTSIGINNADLIAYSIGTNINCDFGDNPDIAGSGPAANDYPTLGASGGPMHGIPTLPIFYLGAGVSFENEALTNATATGDADDGITIPILTQTQTASIIATVVGTGGYLQGWIDWNGDGDFVDTGEQIATDIQDNNTGDTNAAVGTIAFNVSVPATAITTPTFARFRWSTASGLNSNIYINNGEVEDYALTINAAKKISGIVFEDMNYGGGSGRSQTASSGVGVNGAKVELYNSTGTLVATTTTVNDGTTDGTYTFNSVTVGSYYIRVVSDTVNSTRTGSNGTELAVQTFRTDGTTAVTNEVGGRNPALADGVANTGTETLNTTSFKLSGGGHVQSLQAVTLTTTDVTGIDFGFNFDTIVNTNDAGQGSLRQFILNSNQLGGEASLAQAGSRKRLDNTNEPLPAGYESSIFMIPSSALTSGVAKIQITSSASLLPSVVGSKTILDASTQTTNQGDTNTGFLGTGGTVGVDALTLAKIPAPEVELFPAAAGYNYGIHLNNTGVVMRGFAAYGFGNDVNSNGVIVVGGSGNSVIIEQNILGTTASSFTVPSLRGQGSSIQTGASGGFVRNNLIGFSGANGLRMNGNTWTVKANEIRSNGLGSADGLWGYFGSNMTIEGNLITDNASGGYDGLYRSSFTNNTVTYNGRDASSLEDYGVSVVGDGSVINRNIFTNNTGQGVLIYNNVHPTTLDNWISQNSMFANGKLGIDLVSTAGNTSGDNVSINDSNDSDTGANHLLNFPQIREAHLVGGMLTLRGCAPAGASIELFEADVSPTAGSGVSSGANQLGKTQDYGEGQRYLLTLTEGVGEDESSNPVNCTTLTDADNNSATGMNPFQWTIALPTGVVSGDLLTATATLSGSGTSEFSAVAIVEQPLDYGDAPASYGSPTHVIISGTHLGTTSPDNEAAASPTVNADGDDLSGTDDEDGVILPSLIQGQSASIMATVTGAGSYLQGWIDFNGDGDFTDSGEQVANNLQDNSIGDTNATTGTIAFTVNVPTGAVTTQSYARFRWSTTQNLDDTTQANDGEVEDYSLTIAAPPPPFSSCPAETFVTLGASASSIDLYALDLNTGSLNLLGSNAILQNSVNAIGFRQQDGYLWGWNNKAGSIGLMRIGMNGIADMPYGTTQPSGLPLNRTIYRGDISPAGVYTLMHFGSKELWNIDVTTNSVISGPVVLSTAIGTDLAYHPTDGFLYAISDTTGEVQRINPTTGIVTGLGLILPVSTGWGAVMFDNKGILYAYNGNTGTVYRIFNVAGNGTLTFDRLANSLTAANLDGARCVNAAPSGGAAVLVTATTVGGTAGAFSFKLVNAVNTTGSVSTNNANTPAIVDGDTTVTGLQPFSIPSTQLNQVLTIEETALPNDWELSTATCTLNGSVVGSLSGNTYSLPANLIAPGNLIECNFSHVEILRDYGDAPASYGSPTHVIISGTHLGTASPDNEAAASPTVNADGDDLSGTDDEEGISLPTEFITREMTSISVTVAGTGGKLQAWIDWNADGDFADTGEQIAKNLADNAGIDTDPSTGVINFNVTPPATAVSGNTYARFRWSTQTNLSATVAANDGEVEDYAITIVSGGTPLSIAGRVYHDLNVNGVDDNEAGLKDVVVVLHNVTTGTCSSMKTAADGSYQFDDLLAGDYTVIEAVSAKLPTPATCPATPKDPNGFTSSTANVLTIALSTTAVNDANFGDVKAPVFSLDNSKVILPNSTITYPHTFQTYVDGNVLFSIAQETADPNDLNWSASLFLDTNCDAKLGQEDTAITTALAVNAGTKLCILAKVLAPADAPAGALHVLTVSSDFQYGDASLIAASNIQTHTDRTQTSTGSNTEDPSKPISGEGKLSLEKTVLNVTRNIEGSVALPGETLRYTIHYENIGNGLLNELAIQDSVPEFTQLVPNSLLCGTTPPELTACSPQVNSNSLEWVFAGQLKAGSKGQVSYNVTVE